MAANARSLKRRFDPFQKKTREDWFYRRSNFPLRDAAPLELERFWERREQYIRARGIQWEDAGPHNYAGRVTCLAVDPYDPDRIYAGSAAGGVWVSSDRGDHWQSCWPRFLNQNIGALAFHPEMPYTLICATGEANMSPESYPGSGVFLTYSGGLTWKPAFSSPLAGRLSPSANEAFPRRIGTIAFGPTPKPGKIPLPRFALGAVSHDETMPAGLYLNDESGAGLQPVIYWGNRSYNCHAVVFHPRNASRIYAAIQPRGSMNGIWRSDSSGKTWQQLTRGLPPGEVCGRISLAISRSDPDILYAQIASLSRAVLGVFRTTNGGDSWLEVGRSHFADERQMRYNNTICIHPDNPKFVVCGGVDLHRTTDGGRTWKRITTGQRGTVGHPPRSNFVHFDHHAVVIPGGKAGDRIYSGNDGGVAVSENGGNSWKEKSNGMGTVMFYEVDVAPGNSKMFGGGAQDTGTLIAGIGKKPLSFTRVRGGDGGWIVFDPADEEHVFVSDSNLNIFRHQRGDPWAHGPFLARWEEVPPPVEKIERQQRAIVVVEIDPRQRKGFKTLWAGTSRLWRSRNNGLNWKPASPYFDGSSISAIEISRRNPRLMFVGTSDGGIFRSVDGGKTWSASLAGMDIPKRLITRIEVHPRSSQTVVATVACNRVPGARLVHRGQPGRDGDNNHPFGHVFQSDDMGNTWRDIDGGKLPDVVYNAMAFETHPPYRLFIGGDTGVWMRTASGHWASITANMPDVVVSDLLFHHKDRILTAATYGRGMWRLRVKRRIPLVAGRTPEEVTDAPLAAGLIRDDTVPAPKLLAPENRMLFTHFPREVHLEWEPVKGAIGYAIDVIYEGGVYMSYGSRTPDFTFEHFSDGTTTWRVWAIFEDSRRSPGSELRSFVFKT